MKGYLQKALEASLKRRDFLKIASILGISLSISPVTTAATLTEVKFDKKLHKLEHTLPLMGTDVTITVLDSSADRAEEAIEAGFDCIRRLSTIFDRFKTNTTVSVLNTRGKLDDVPPQLQEVWQRSFYYYRLSQGAFDVTVKPLVDLLKDAFAQTGKPPSESQIREALKVVGSDKVSFSNRRIRLLEGMGLTFDGIAKGYIVDKTAELIKSKGVPYALINAGGDIRAIGDRKWKVAIRDPFDKEAYVDVIALNNNAIATSGNYEVYFDKEKLYCHIVNPSTGISPRLSSSTSVIAKTVTDADALSTTAFVLKPLQAKNFLERIGKAGLIITRQGIKLVTNNWPRIA